MCQVLLYTVLFFDKFTDLLEMYITMGTYEMTSSVRFR